MKNLLNIGVTLSINQLKKINGEGRRDCRCNSASDCDGCNYRPTLDLPTFSCVSGYCVEH